MRIVSWNLRKAKEDSMLWDIFLKIEPDIAMLQEFNSAPKLIMRKYQLVERKAITKNGTPQRFSTAILIKGQFIDKIPLSSQRNWVNEKLKHYQGNILAHKANIAGIGLVKLVSVYSPAWPVNITGIDVAQVEEIKLKYNDQLWMTEILWDSLKNQNTKNEKWVVAGDFNASETFDYLWSGGPRGNKEIIMRMNNLGLTECLRSYKGELVPTFKNPKGGKILHQLDHLYVSKSLMSDLKYCETGNKYGIFENNLSDHLPIIADFEQSS